MDTQPKQFYLASASPRRAELMPNSLRFEIRPTHVEEDDWAAL